MDNTEEVRRNEMKPEEGGTDAKNYQRIRNSRQQKIREKSGSKDQNVRLGT